MEKDFLFIRTILSSMVTNLCLHFRSLGLTILFPVLVAKRNSQPSVGTTVHRSVATSIRRSVRQSVGKYIYLSTRWSCFSFVCLVTVVHNLSSNSRSFILFISFLLLRLPSSPHHEAIIPPGVVFIATLISSPCFSPFLPISIFIASSTQSNFLS